VVSRARAPAPHKSKIPRLIESPIGGGRQGKQDEKRRKKYREGACGG
jgi:hypothetical protein